MGGCGSPLPLFVGIPGVDNVSISRCHFLMRNKLLLLPALFLMLAASMQSIATAETDAACYELRVYYAAPGKLDDLHARFRNHTMKIFQTHGMQNFGYWVPLDNTNNTLIYLLGHKDRDTAKKSWSEFSSDPEWKQVQKESEANGKLVNRVESTFLTRTDYSPDVKNTKTAAPRTFELRTYKATAGKLDDLHARFRDHTLRLFSKHGMAHYGYWTPMDKSKGADDTLIYILAHKNREAAEASFKDFREDPDWIAVRKASEEKAGGSLTVKVDSLFMKPTDYSPTQ